MTHILDNSPVEGVEVEGRKECFSAFFYANFRK